MKGVLVQEFGGPEVLEYRDLPEPVLQDDQILIEVEGTSINYADIKARQGSYHLKHPLPFIPGLEATGRILTAGSEVTQFRPGERVVCFPATGGYAERAAAHKSLTFAIPETLDSRQAAAFPLVMGIATHLLYYAARVTAGEHLIIHAATGGVGMAALRIAKHLGLTSIIGTSSNPAKQQSILDHGFDSFVLLNNDSYKEKIFEYTAERGADVILNPIGGNSLHHDLECLAPFGRLISYGKMTEDDSNLNLNKLYTTNKAIIGVSFGHYRKNRADHVGKVMNKAIQLIGDGDVSLPIAAVLPLHEASQAHRYIEERNLIGKIILSCND